MGDPWDDENGPAFQDDDPTVVEAVEELSAEAVTAPHDAAEWLAGFEAGKKGRMMDVLQALISVQLADGKTMVQARAYAERVRRRLVEMEATKV